MRRFIGFVVAGVVLASCGGDSKPRVACLRGDRGAEAPRPIGRVDHCPLFPTSFRFAYMAVGHFGAGRHIADGELYALGTRMPTDLIYRDGVFDYQMFERLAGQAGLPVEAMVAEQGRELLAAAMRERIGEAGLAAWLTERCTRLKAAGRISIEPELVARTDDSGAPLPGTYAPCARWRSP